jgi:hypothetical protein
MKGTCVPGQAFWHGTCQAAPGMNPSGERTICLTRASKSDRCRFSSVTARFLELEIEAQPRLAGLPVSALQIDNEEDVVWLAKACATSANLTDPSRLKKERSST